MFQGLHFMSDTAMGYIAICLGTFWEYLRTDHHTLHPRSTFQTAEAPKFYEGVNTFLYRFPIKNILVMRLLIPLERDRNDNPVHFSEVYTSKIWKIKKTRKKWF